MKIQHSRIKDILFTIAVLCAFFVISLAITELFHTPALTTAVFTLAVFLVALLTQSYVYGILASLISVLAVNFAFTFPYFKFNFSIPENLVSAVIMLVITCMTSALTTKLKQQEKLKAETEKEKMRANLLRAISHDLRTPLTAIYGSSSAILENFESLTTEDLKQMAEGIREDSEWLIGMVENLLSVTRIDNQGVKLVKSPVVLEELIDSVLVRFSKRFPSQEVDVEMPEEFISIPMDAVLITQVIVNMLENAVRHAKGMTMLKLRVFTEGEKVVFEIIDNGCGIAKERLGGIFTGYLENRDVPADHQKHNMGIGLSVCASIIKAHDGEICAENRTEGGCCFRFSLNMEEDGNEQ
ncbi:MAG: DUF4118 domain-containing protein [Lachnospiraceae bacterium]|nr:DUF4118 domain-containing protein [Lachnospiraceae bacterium]